MPRFRFNRSRPAGKSTRRHLIESLEARTLLAADTLSVFIGGAAAKAVTFIDPNGTKAIVNMAGQGNATVTFSGTNLSQAASAIGVAVSGSGVTLASIALTHTGLDTVLHVRTVGRNPLTLGGLTSDGVVNSILAPGVVVTGNLTTAGWVHQITLSGAQNGTISIGPTHSNGGFSMTVGTVSDESLVSDVRVNDLTVGQWLNTTGAAESIVAPQALTIRSRGNFAPDLSIAGIRGADVSLQTFVAGAITGGSLNVSGKVHSFNAGSIAGGWNGTVSGTVDDFHVTHDATMNLTASIINNLAVFGALSNSTVSLTEPLSTIGFDLFNLYTGGAIVNSTIESVGSIKAVSALSMQNSGLYVGLQAPVLPTMTSAFANIAEIRSVTLRRSASASFAASNIAAYQLGTLVLGAVQTSNGGTPFGVAGHSIQSITLVDQTTRHVAHETNVPSAAAFHQVLVSKGINQGDLVVDVV